MEQQPITKQQRNAINSLNRLAKRWPDGIGLYSHSGTLLVVASDGMVLSSILDIPNDGGDAGVINRNGFEYLDLD